MKSITIFGDSHSRYFEINEKLKFHAPWINSQKVKVIKIPASSIVGLGKSRSKLNVLNKVEELLDREELNVFAFGQVDLELGYYYRKVVKEENVNLSEFVTYLLDSYEVFVTGLGIPNQNVVLKGLNLTVLKHPGFAFSYIKRIILENEDEPMKIKVLENSLKEKLESFGERNKATLLFNDGLKKICKKNQWKYFDVNDVLSDYTPGKGISDRYIPATFDHHVVDSLEVRKLHLSRLVGVV